MRRIVFALVAGVALAGVVASMAPASGQADGEATPIFVDTIPPGYRDWRLISVAHEAGDLNDLRAMLGNDIARTGVLFVDPYNDFLSEGGKLWPRVKEVAEPVGLIGNLKAVVKTIREKSIQVFIVPHHRWEPGDYQRWKHVNPSQIASDEMQLCAKGSGVANGARNLRRRLATSL